MPFRSPHPSVLRQRVAGALLVTGIGVTLALPFGAGAAAPAPSAAATVALDWQAAQLMANGGTMPGFMPGMTDWGLTADAVLAFAAAGRTTDPAAVAATDALAANAA